MTRVRRKRYTAECTAEAVRLVHTSDRRVTEIAEHLGVTAKTRHEWVRAVRPPAPARVTADERSALERLRRDNARLRMERDIFNKAAAFCARETQE